MIKRKFIQEAAVSSHEPFKSRAVSPAGGRRASQDSVGHEEESVLHGWLEYVGSFVERTGEVTLGGSDSC